MKIGKDELSKMADRLLGLNNDAEAKLKKMIADTAKDDDMALRMIGGCRMLSHPDLNKSLKFALDAHRVASDVRAMPSDLVSGSVLIALLNALGHVKNREMAKTIISANVDMWCELAELDTVRSLIESSQVPNDVLMKMGSVPSEAFAAMNEGARKLMEAKGVPESGDDPTRDLTEEQKHAILRNLERRLNDEPMEDIAGFAEFGIDLGDMDVSALTDEDRSAIMNQVRSTMGMEPSDGHE